MDYVGKSVGYVGKSVGYAAITHTFQPMKSIRSDVPWYKYIYTRNVLLSAQMGERASVVLICITRIVNL